MKTTVRKSKTKVNMLTPEQKDKLDREGAAILEKIGQNFKSGVPAQDESNIALLQEHFDWAKQFYTSNKIEYLKYVKILASDANSIKALNSIQAGLPAYMRVAAMTHIAKIN